ncbi:translation elongation factor Ts [Mycoplasmopsis hyopharyngis]|uniref:translation elongation factor Ts n=1 Tax=Mycoplasmopsis hyopharyngis TaxID=29558 RepID=UPI003873447D
MAEVNKMALIKELRERTNGGMMDCKNALEASEWNIDKAIQWLKENGKVKAAKKAGRISAEGLVTIAGDEKEAVIVEVNSETDFVAKNEKFIKLVEEIAQAILKSKAKTNEEAANVKVGKETITSLCENATATIGEKITFRRFVRVKAAAGQVLGNYVHINGQMASIVLVKGANQEAARKVSMHVSAMNPEFALLKDLPESKIKEIESKFEEPAGFDKKPANIQKIIKEGWITKQFSDFVLEKQNFVMDESLTIEKFLSQSKCELVKFARFEVGEGITKVETDFAKEVAAAQAEVK